MTEEEIMTAALSDPDAQPTPERDLDALPPITGIQRLRRSLRLTQHQFADRYHIPIGMLRDWEQGRVTPDKTAQAYITVIPQEPVVVQRALELSTRR